MKWLKHLKIIPADPTHEQFLYELRNHPSTRCHMFDDREIDLSDHKKWFSQSLKNADRSIFILEKDAAPIGQIRFDRTGNSAEIDFAVIPEERKRGWGWYILVMTCFKMLRDDPGLDYLTATVKSSNVKSREAFETAGFQPYAENEKTIAFRLIKSNRAVVIATSKSWNIRRFFKRKKNHKDKNWVLIKHKDQLVKQVLHRIDPEWVFFPHWSWLIPESVFKTFECVVFHMTPLPFGRGGSPLQNLISRGIYQTKISAIKVVRELDAGDIYCQRNFDLSHGSADELFDQASAIVYDEMIPQILTCSLIPQKQQGKVVSFDRRTPEQSDISELDNMDQIYDFIRMLDGEGYPRAFLKLSGISVEFFNAEKKDGEIIAKCIFKRAESREKS